MLADQMARTTRIGSKRLRSGMLRPIKTSPMRRGGIMRRKNGEGRSPSRFERPGVRSIQFVVFEKILNQIIVDPVWLL